MGATALHMAVRRNSVQCAVAMLEAANCVKGGHGRRARTGSLTTSEEETSAEDEGGREGAGGELEGEDHREQQRKDLHGQAREGSRKLNKLKDNNGDTPLHWAVKTNK